MSRIDVSTQTVNVSFSKNCIQMQKRKKLEKKLSYTYILVHFNDIR